MQANADLVGRVTSDLIRARTAAYIMLGVAATFAAAVQGNQRYLAIAVALGAALAVPYASTDQRLFCLLVGDSVLALVAWWLIGPAAGPDFLLLIIAGIAGVALTGRQWRLVAGLVVFAEAAQIPLHFWAKYGPEPPLFHPPAQIVGDVEFTVGVLVRTLILILAASVFRLVGRRLASSRSALLTSQATFKAAFHEAPIGVGLISSERQLVAVNELLAALAPPDTRRLEDIVDELAKQEVASGVEAVVTGHAPRFEAELRTAAGRESRIVRMVVSPIEEAAGDVVAVATVDDVTDIVGNQQRLEQLVQSKDEFIASVSHELRTPLTAVVGFSDILREDVELSVGERQALIDDIARESREVSSLVEDLLVIARADIGTVTIIPDRLDIEEELGQILAGLESERAIAISCSACWAWADPLRFRQIIRNLFTNAFRYGGDKVALSAHLVGDRIRIVVSDDGEGVPGDPELIFQPYVRAHERPTQPASVGLGLAVSRSLARAMGGDLTYERADGWSRFTLTIPPALVPIDARPPDVRLSPKAAMSLAEWVNVAGVDPS